MVGRLTSPTVASVLRLVKTFFAAWAKKDSFSLPTVQALSLTMVRVRQPLQGLVVKITWQTFSTIARAIESFTANRPIRTANDLARPLR